MGFVQKNKGKVAESSRLHIPNPRNLKKRTRTVDQSQNE